MCRTIAEKTEGLSGREIAKLAVSWQVRVKEFKTELQHFPPAQKGKFNIMLTLTLGNKMI